MAKGVELTDDQLEAFAGGRDLVVVNGGAWPAKIIDLNTGKVIYDTYYEADALEWAKANMQSGEKIYRMSTWNYFRWKAWQGAESGPTWG